MSVVNYEEIEKLTSNTKGFINEDVISYAKNFLIANLRMYLNPESLERIEKKIQELDIRFLDDKEFKENFKDANGKGFIPGGYYYNGAISFLSDTLFKGYSFHKLIHEMLHSISDNHQGKNGLYIVNYEDKYHYGYGINEACTEFLASIICDEPFYGYATDLKLMWELFRNISSLSMEEILNIYLNKENWLTSDLALRFSRNENNLAILVSEYDERISQVAEREFNADKVLNVMIEVLKEKITLNKELNYAELTTLIKEYYDYLSDTWSIREETTISFEELLDLLELKNKENKSLE